MVDRYLDDWIVDITDVTEHVRHLHTAAVTDPTLLPPERPYPLPAHLAASIGATG
ncbi:hypothetical protein AB0I55_25295 [Actinocatenispora sera]|uniref:hypothetical protein n=1 Tax=Actinocatenispora sera TaxID=390989 RepID=UPI00340A0F3A